MLSAKVGTCTTALNRALSFAVKAAVAVPPTAPTPSGTMPLKDESCRSITRKPSESWMA